jgi:hypothetical protein
MEYCVVHDESERIWKEAVWDNIFLKVLKKQKKTLMLFGILAEIRIETSRIRACCVTACNPKYQECNVAAFLLM